MPDDYHALFKNQYFTDKRTGKLIYITDLNIKKGTVEMAEIVQVIDNKTGISENIMDPGTTQRVTLDEAYKSFF